MRWENRVVPFHAMPVTDSNRAVVPSDQLLQLLQDAVADRYVVLRILGKGGMGSVFLARELALDRLVAVKVAVLAPGESPDVLDRFRREARLAASLEHPHVVRVYAVGDGPDLVWFAMEYVEGPTLERFVREHGPLSSARTLQMLREVSDALAYAHERNIIHRDIKPANLLLTLDGRYLLSDFGIAKQSSEEGLTTTGRIIGTPAYMSPEQFRGQELTAASDQYALGCVAYFARTGREPFQEANVAGLIRAHLLDAPPSLSSIVPDVPPALERVVHRLLSKQAEERFPLTASISAALQDESPFVPPRSASTLARFSAAIRQHRTRSVSAITLLCAAAFGLWRQSSVHNSTAEASVQTTAAISNVDTVRAAPNASPRRTSASKIKDSPSESAVPSAAGSSIDAAPSAPPAAPAPDSKPVPIDAPPSAASGVRIGSRISGAVLFVNDAPAGVLGEPMRFTVPAGTVTLAVKAEGCRSWDTTVVIPPGELVPIGYRNPRCR